MEQKLKEKIAKISSFLSTEDKAKDIVEIEDNSENLQIIDYLESIGSERVRYEINAKPQFRKTQEIKGIIYLWYKKLNGNWIIKLKLASQLE